MNHKMKSNFSVPKLKGVHSELQASQERQISTPRDKGKRQQKGIIKKTMKPLVSSEFQFR